MFIQMEYCNGGSVEGVIKKNRKRKTQMDERDVRQMIYHMAHGLKYIHAQGYIHALKC